jgi:S1-C subfamily serine protease
MEAADQPVPSVSRNAFRRRSIRITAGIGVLALAGSLWAFSRSPSKATPVQTAASVKAAVDKAIVASEKKALARPALSALAFQRVVPSIVFIRTQEVLDGSDATTQDSSPADTTTPDPTGIPDTTTPVTTTPDTTAPESAAAAESDGQKNADGENGGLGTGVIINAEGAILTANHVVDGAKLIRVTFIDGTTSNATIISSQPERDIAVLKADQNPEVVVPAVMGGGVRVGDEAFAIGHPLGLIDSMSSGVISGLDRSIPIGEDQTLDGLIQFDTAVNPGNSGGPLLNRAGQVVGIVTALANPSEQGVFIGIGFAVPIGAAAGVAGGGPDGPPR